MRAAPIAVESVTPRIDSECRCRCAAPIVWDEVYGWLHVGTARDPCSRPDPAPATGTD